ncbi:hypothetical protein [Alteromonas halophila]|nr:hypothetical protein [Alteromonas halophila]
MPSILRITSFFFAALFICSAQGSEFISIDDSRFSEPLTFRISLPESYNKKTDKRYTLLFDFHYYGHTYLNGMHDWLSHNGEWPWPETIIVTPVRGNPVGQLFDSSGEQTPLIDFFAESLLPRIDKQYRTNGYRIMSGFRVNATLVLSAMLSKPTLFDAYFAASPELKDDYAKIMSTLERKGVPEQMAGRYLLYSHGSSVKEQHQLQEYRQLHRLLQRTSDIAMKYDYRDFSEHEFMTLPLFTLLTGIERLYELNHSQGTKE